MAVIRADKFGPYIKSGGYIFRPVFPAGYSHVYTDGTDFKEGEHQPAQHIGGTPLAKVGKGASKEVWFSHGAYLGTDDYTGSESRYKPDYEYWK